MDNLPESARALAAKRAWNEQMRHIHPLEPIAVIVLIVILVYIKKKRDPKVSEKGAKAAETRAAVVKPVKVEEPPEVVYMRRRKQALETLPGSLGSAGDVREDEPYGLVMEMGISSSVVTLACFANGDAGLYYQTGGGMIGGIAHDNVRKAAQEFVALAPKAMAGMSPATDHPLPDPDTVRFYVLTPRGTFTTQTDREALAEPGNELAPLFYSGQEVVAQMRQVQAQRAQAS